MTIVFTASSKSAFPTVVGDVSESSAITQERNIANSKGCMQLGSSFTEMANYVEVDGFTQSSLFVHFVIGFEVISTATMDNNFFRIYSDDGKYFQIRLDTAGGLAIASYYNGSILADIGSISNMVNDAPIVFDVHVSWGASGLFQVYVEGVQELSYTFNGGANTDAVRFANAADTGTTSYLTYLSEVIVADESTIGYRLVTLAPDAAGNYNEFDSGGYADVDEYVPDNAYAQSGTVGQRLSFSVDALGALGAGEDILALVPRFDAFAGVSGPQSMNTFSRSGGTDYHNSSHVLSTSIAHYQDIVSVDPATSAAWTVAGVNGAEFGVRSQT